MNHLACYDHFDITLQNNFVFHSILELKNKFDRDLIVFFWSIVFVKINGSGHHWWPQSEGVHFSAVFSFLKCLFAGHSGFMCELYHGAYAHVKIVFALTTSTRYHAVSLIYLPGTPGTW